jgi:hypothetical protein
VHLFEWSSSGAMHGEQSPEAMLLVKRCPDGENDLPCKILIRDRHCFTFGRDPRSDVVLRWDGMSRAHAWLDVVPVAAHDGRAGWELVCNGSGNGSFVNGVRRSRAVLKHGDCIAFGHGHDVQEGEALEDEAFVYMFQFESLPCPDVIKPDVQTYIAQSSDQDRDLSNRIQQLKPIQSSTASPMHRRALAARSAAAENLEVGACFATNLCAYV